jgi:hypothetical protein
MKQESTAWSSSGDITSLLLVDCEAIATMTHMNFLL